MGWAEQTPLSKCAQYALTEKDDVSTVAWRLIITLVEISKEGLFPVFTHNMAAPQLHKP